MEEVLAELHYEFINSNDYLKYLYELDLYSELGKKELS